MRLLLCLLLMLAGAGQPVRAGAWPPWHRAQPYERYVTRVPYQGHLLMQKRTPADQLPRRNAAPIVALEKLLAGRYRALRRSDTATLFSAAQRDSLYQMQALVHERLPDWNIRPYRDEAFFYIQTQEARELLRLHLRFNRAQQQRDSLRGADSTVASRATFEQATEAGQTAAQAQRWATAATYFARCRALQPTDSVSCVRYVQAAENCLDWYFGRFVQAGEALRRKSDQTTIANPLYWPEYQAALPQLTNYLNGLSAACAARWQAGQRDYLVRQLTALLRAQDLLPAGQLPRWRTQAQAALDAYQQRYGDDKDWQLGQQLLQTPAAPATEPADTSGD